jgi:hypothetical protein
MASAPFSSTCCASRVNCHFPHRTASDQNPRIASRPTSGGAFGGICQASAANTVATDALDRSDVEAEYLCVQERHRAQRLILRRRTDLFVDGEPGEKRDKLGCAHGRRVLFLMKENVSPNPVDVRLLRPAAVVPQAHSGAHAVEELRRRPTLSSRGALVIERGPSAIHTLPPAPRPPCHW